MIISIDAEKACIKIQHLFMIKSLVKLGIEEMYFNIIKAIYNKPILNGLKLKPFTSKLGRRRGCLLCPFLFNMVLIFLGKAKNKKKHKEFKQFQDGS
jgi:hypothetical protein